MDITDDYMRARLQESREYSIVLLRRGPADDAPDRDRLVWEHGRRNFALLEQGLLPIVCPVPDDSDLCGVAIFNASIFAGEPVNRLVGYRRYPSMSR